jgi:hypothetical protein
LIGKTPCAITLVTSLVNVFKSQKHSKAPAGCIQRGFSALNPCSIFFDGGLRVHAIEAHARQLLRQLGILLTQGHLLLARVPEIEGQGHSEEIRCGPGRQPYQLYKQKHAIHPKSTFGERNHLTRTVANYSEFLAKTLDQAKKEIVGA